MASVLLLERQLLSLQHGMWKNTHDRHAEGPIILHGNKESDKCLGLTAQGEGSVLSLLSTMQPRTGRATTLRDSATSEMSPVQLKQPAADADLPKGAKSFATGAWLRPAKLTQAAGMSNVLLTRQGLFNNDGLCPLWHVTAFHNLRYFPVNWLASDATPDTHAQGLLYQKSQDHRQDGSLESWTACGD